MTTIWEKNALFDVRKWIIASLTSSGISGVTGYNNIMVPVQQVPIINDADVPTPLGGTGDPPQIVYDLIGTAYANTDDFWTKSDDVSLWIYSSNFKQAMTIKEFLVDLLGRSDLSARDLNSYNVTNSTGSPFTYQYFELTGGQPTDEAKQEFDRIGINMTFAYCYTRPLSATGRFAS